MKFRVWLLVTGLVLMLAAGCAKQPLICISPEDNPQHHYRMGMLLIEQSALKGANTHFERSITCDKSYGPAHGGLALSMALILLVERGSEYEYKDIYKAYEHLELSLKYAVDDNQSFASRLASIRVYTTLKPKGWLKRVVKEYKGVMKLEVEEPVLYYHGAEAADYFMGFAYFEAAEFSKARESLSLVLGRKAEGMWNEAAETLWKKTDKIVRAIAGRTIGYVGKRIAVMETVSRADMAALLVDELKIDKLFAGRIPVKSRLPVLNPYQVPADLTGNPLREEILEVVKWSVRGLEPVYDNIEKMRLFKPAAPVSRKEFALILEDVVIRLTGDESIAAAFFGHRKSPYPDVAVASPWYNAVMNATTRSLMSTELSGEFRPDDPVDGVEALLAIRVLRQKLNIY